MDPIVTGKQVKYYNKTPIKVETIEQYKEYVNAVKYWQSIKKDRNRLHKQKHTQKT